MKQFENLIKSKLENFEAPENPAAWEIFNQKRLAQKKAINKKYFYSGLTGLVLVSMLTCFMLFKNSQNTEKQEFAENQTKDEVIKTDITKTIVENDLPVQNSQKTSKNKNFDANTKNKLPNNNTVIVEEKLSNENPNNNIDVSEKDVTEPNDKTYTLEETNLNTELACQTNELPDLNNIKVDYNIIDVCIPAKVLFSVKGIPNACSFCWNFSTADKHCNKKTVEKTYNESGNYSPTLEIYDSIGKLVKRVYLNEISIYSAPIAKINFENTNNIYTFSSQSENSVRDTWLIDNQRFDKSSLEYNFSKEGTHLVKLRVQNEAGCVDEDTKLVDITITHDYFLPTAFKPNSDGVNSSFGPIGENLHEYSFKMLIFDKTGTMIFETLDVDNLWNGKINGTGAMAEPGVYTWEILTIDKNGVKKHKKGQVRLLIN